MKMVSAVSFVAPCLLWSLAPYLVRGSTLHYDEAKLKQYAEVTQHLRTSLEKMKNDYQSRIDAINEDRLALQTEISDDWRAAIDLLSAARELTSDIRLAMYKIVTPMTVGHCTPSFTDPSKHMYGVTALDHGMAYDNQKGQVMITKAGVYMFEFKGQTNDYRSFKAETWFIGPPTTSIKTYHDWEVSPFYETLHLQVGTVMVFIPFNGVGWNSLSALTPGVATQFSLIYLGKHV